MKRPNPKLERARLTEIPPFLRHFLREVVKRSAMLLIRFIDDVEEANKSDEILDREGYVVGRQKREPEYPGRKPNVDSG